MTSLNFMSPFHMEHTLHKFCNSVSSLFLHLCEGFKFQTLLNLNSVNSLFQKLESSMFFLKTLGEVILNYDESNQSSVDKRSSMFQSSREELRMGRNGFSKMIIVQYWFKVLIVVHSGLTNARSMLSSSLIAEVLLGTAIKINFVLWERYASMWEIVPSLLRSIYNVSGQFYFYLLETNIHFPI
jgi:hypothetical protein